MKTFKQLREAIDKANPEAAALKPRAQGEIDFMDAHTKSDKEYPEKGSDDTVNAREMSSGDHHAQNGDRTTVKQGTSDLADKSGFKGGKTPLTRADKTQGDFKPVRGASSVKPFRESLFVNAPVINESEDDTISIELLNGDVIEINEEIWTAMQEVFANLNTGNRHIFRSAVNESSESFLKMLDFVEQTAGDE